MFYIEFPDVGISSKRCTCVAIHIDNKTKIRVSRFRLDIGLPCIDNCSLSPEILRAFAIIDTNYRIQSYIQILNRLYIQRI